MDAKRPRIENSSDAEGESSNSVANVVAVHVEPQPDIFKLKIICLQEVFEWLSLDELIVVAKTCKRFQQAAGDFYRTNYVAQQHTITDSYIWITKGLMLGISLEMFAEYMKRLTLGSCISADLRYSIIEPGIYRHVAKNCKSLKHIHLRGGLPTEGVQCLKEILSNVETVYLEKFSTKEEFYEFFLKYCTGVTSLAIDYLKLKDDVIVGSSNEWMHRKCPTLRNLELMKIPRLQQNEFQIFFAQNPNVRTFSTDLSSLWRHRQLFLTSGAKLDKFAIEFPSHKVDNPKRIVNLLAKLQDCGFYKRLNIYNTCLENMLNLIGSSSVANTVESICVAMVDLKIPLPNLKVFGIRSFPGHFYLPSTGEDRARTPFLFPKLERIYLHDASAEDILPFIRSSSKLNTIRIHRFNSKAQEDSINLLALNKEREKLEGASKIVIYINEKSFLDRKWNNKPMTSNMIELRRLSSFESPEINFKYTNTILTTNDFVCY